MQSINKRFNIKEYTNQDIKDAIATIKDGMQFNNKQIVANIGKPGYSNMNMDLYMRNLELEKQLKAFKKEKEKREKTGIWN